MNIHRRVTKIVIETISSLLIVLFMILPGTFPMILIGALVLTISALTLDLIGLVEAASRMRQRRQKVLHIIKNIKTSFEVIVGILLAITPTQLL